MEKMSGVEKVCPIGIMLFEDLKIRHFFLKAKAVQYFKYCFNMLFCLVSLGWCEN